jgi:hypothetical protein
MDAAYLQIILRIPVAVVDDAGVSSSQINTQTTSLGAQQENKPKIVLM